jgi:hypothetical protein
MKPHVLFFALALLAAVLVVSGCTATVSTNDPAEEARASCIAECRLELERGFYYMPDGPCLSDNNPRWDVDDWVCDVAHSPRLAIDNEPPNQCTGYRTGAASHFVEVDPECNFIRAV